MKWIFLSPHLDDVVFSCGGFLWDLTASDQQVEIWTICAADPPPGELSPLAVSLHQDWGLGRDAYQTRRGEDRLACQILGALPTYLDFLDCIYRQSPEGEVLYASEAAIFGGLDARESGLIDSLTAELEQSLPGDARVVAPLGIGNHVDHELTRKAASRLAQRPVYYADYPYAREIEGKQTLDFMGRSADWSPQLFQISELGRAKWFEAARAYSSQLAIFWQDQAALQKDLLDFEASGGGVKLWKADSGAES